MHLLRVCSLLLILAAGLSPEALALSKKPGPPAPRLRNALTVMSIQLDFTKTQAPTAFHGISRAEDPWKRLRQPAQRPDPRTKPPTRGQGIGFLIAGVLCLGGSAALFKVGSDQRRDSGYTDLGALLAFCAGTILAIVGLSLTIPGIVFLSRY